MRQQMDECVDALRRALEAEAGLYDEMLVAAEEQRKALVARKLDAIEAVTGRRNGLVTRAAKLEGQSRAALEGLSAHLGIEGALTVSTVAGKLDTASARPLLALRDHLLDSASKLSRAEYVNMCLFESAMDSVRFTLSVLADACREPEPCYAPGDANRAGVSFLLDQHA